MKTVGLLVVALAACSGSHASLGEDGGAADLARAGLAPDGPAAPPVGSKRVFVTGGTYAGDLRTVGGGATGLEGADKLCVAAASGAGLGGSWKAWLSDSTTNAISRIADVGPWYRMDGVRAFDSMAAPSVDPDVAINRTERGELLGTDPPTDQLEGEAFAVWTGTNGTGVVTPDTCADWTSALAGTVAEGGYASASVLDWTDACNGNECNCDRQNRLYCFEQ